MLVAVALNWNRNFFRLKLLHCNAIETCAIASSLCVILCEMHIVNGKLISRNWNDAGIKGDCLLALMHTQMLLVFSGRFCVPQRECACVCGSLCIVCVVPHSEPLALHINALCVLFNICTHNSMCLLSSSLKMLIHFYRPIEITRKSYDRNYWNTDSKLISVDMCVVCVCFFIIIISFCVPVSHSLQRIVNIFVRWASPHMCQCKQGLWLVAVAAVSAFFKRSYTCMCLSSPWVCVCVSVNSIKCVMRFEFGWEDAYVCVSECVIHKSL